MRKRIDEYVKSGDFDVYKLVEIVNIEREATFAVKKMTTVIQSMDDVTLFSDFWERYDYRISMITDACCDLHDLKLLHNVLSESDFYGLYETDKKMALSQLFQHEISFRDIKKMENQKLTPKDIYCHHQSDRSISFYHLLDRLTRSREGFQLAQY